MSISTTKNPTLNVAIGDAKAFSGFVRGNESDTGWDLDDNHKPGERSCTYHVAFPTSFESPPLVTVSLKMIDIDKNFNDRIVVDSANITRDGFDAIFATWWDTIVYNAEMSWTAIGK
jgi:hypothetical protein